jgi:hypothetical protein
MCKTQAEYKAYQEAVERFFEKEGINCLSATTGESEFSYSPCECCRRPLGGDRYAAKGYHAESNEVFEYSVCTDCLYYAEYGQLDDMTMMDIK